MSQFSDSMNAGNQAFGLVCGESFQNVGKVGIRGTYQAISIDDMTPLLPVAPGGFKNESTTTLFVTRSVLNQSLIADGAILLVRGRRVRVKDDPIDQGDDTLIVNCEGTGAKI